MNLTKPKDVTVLLNAVGAGDESAPEELLAFVYDDLRRLARAHFANEKPDHTLQPTALVHEAYIRLVSWENVSWQNRAHFFAVAANVMRNILIDHARKKNAQKRSGGQRILLEEAVGFQTGQELDLLALDEALQTLEKVDGRQAKIVELRFFGGLSIEETACVLKISETTVRREWTFAKAWFQRELTRD
ncbi:MAG: sigma-70 family RNA polymerase sigma factor [Pyrinomonadaceae bacterium]